MTMSMSMAVVVVVSGVSANRAQPMTCSFGDVLAIAGVGAGVWMQIVRQQI